MSRYDWYGAEGEVQATLGIEEVPFSHNFADLTGEAVVARFRTQRYSTAPLLLICPMVSRQGMGQALFTEVMRIARDLGARSEILRPGLTRKPSGLEFERVAV